MENNNKNKFKYHTVLFEYLIDSVINTLLYYLCYCIVLKMVINVVVCYNLTPHRIVNLHTPVSI